MASIEHLQRTFTRSTGWPYEGLTLTEAAFAMEPEAGRFAARDSFADAVLTPDGTRERGGGGARARRMGGIGGKGGLRQSRRLTSDGFGGLALHATALQRGCAAARLNTYAGRR